MAFSYSTAKRIAVILRLFFNLNLSFIRQNANIKDVTGSKFYARRKRF